MGLDVLEAKDVSSLAVRRPVDRGYVVAWDVQREIWARALRKTLPAVAPSSCGLVLTEPYFNLPALREATMQVIFQDLGFASLVLLPSAILSLRWLAARMQGNPHGPTAAALAAGCALVVDAGFSYTHAVPVFDWHVVPAGLRRIDLGGKALTNYLKELVSYRSINMADESYLLEHIKDRSCFVSLDPRSDLEACRRRDSPFRREWLLPDGVTSTWGHKRHPGEPRGPKDPILVVNNERFMVPEALFNPADIGMDEAGLAETVAAAVRACHPQLHGLLYSNVLITGGTTRCPGFKERFEMELRPLVPDDYTLYVTLMEEPHLAAWRGGAVLGSTPGEYQHLAVTRAEWQQHGAAAAVKWEV